MAVKITGTILASLFYDNSSKNGDQCGFLLGEVIRDVKDTISDSQINNVQVETKIYVYDSVPCPKDQSIFNKRGEVNIDSVKYILKDKFKSIIGWYCFRRNSTLRPSYRERLVHASLLKVLDLDTATCTLLLCSEKSKTNQSTHVFDHCFLYQHESGFSKFPVTVVNLGDTTHTEYRYSASHTVSSRSGIFHNIIQQQANCFLNEKGAIEVKQIQALNRAIGEQLESIARGLIDSEIKVESLEQQLSLLRGKAKKKYHEENATKKKSTEESSPAAIKQSLNETKQLSVDDLLFMDEEESPVIPAPDQINNHARGQDHSPVSSILTDATFVDIRTGKETTSTPANHEEPVSSHATNKTKLTAPVSLHTRSKSNPVDTALVSGQSAIIHTRSRSKDSNGVPSPKMSDPFAFVSDEMMSSKGVASPIGDCSGAVDTLSYSNRAGSVKGRLTDSAAASVARKLSTRPQSETSQRQKVLHGSKHLTQTTDSKGALNPLYELEKMKGKDLGSTKCSQEASKQVDMNKEEDGSQDKYEIDVSSSSVY